jgi:hypothetical protein
VRAGLGIPRRLPPVRPRIAPGVLSGLALSALLASACASRYGPPAAGQTTAALERWGSALSRSEAAGAANVLYEARVSQGLLKTDGTLALRLRENEVDGSLSGPFGAPIATYRDGELRGEKIRPVSLPARQLRALLAGVWTGAAPEVAGQRGDTVLLRWRGEDAAEGVFDVAREELRSLRIERAEGELEVRFSGRRNPWPDDIAIHEKKTGGSLRLHLISREPAP